MIEVIMLTVGKSYFSTLETQSGGFTCRLWNMGLLMSWNRGTWRGMFVGVRVDV